MVEKVRIMFGIPEKLKNDMENQLVKDHYGVRSKSKWVREAIELLLKQKNYVELVRYSNEMENFKHMEGIVLENTLKKRIEDAIINVRKVYPTLEGPQSSIIRTAILQRLVRS